jgi:hypothetical protein
MIKIKKETYIKLFIFFIIICSGIFFVSCVQKNGETSETTTKTTVGSTSDTFATTETETTESDETSIESTAASIESTIDIKELNIEWVFVYTENELGPYTDVSLKISGEVNKTVYIKHVQGQMTNVVDLKEKKYPPEAIIACDGYYAGAGDYFYIKYSEYGYVVMYRMVFESSPETEGEPIPEFEAIQYIAIP